MRGVCVCVSLENLRVLVLLSCHSEEDDMLFSELMLKSLSVALAASKYQPV